jgi:membrane-associated phospholipid phosphatase
VDALIGIRYFQTFYGKSTYVFGAMPSLHCTYPMIGLLTAWRHVTWKTRPIHLAYVALMFCASVYLDHHYVVDGLAGFALAGVSVWIVNWWTSLASSEAKAAAVAT